MTLSGGTVTRFLRESIVDQLCLCPSTMPWSLAIRQACGTVALSLQVSTIEMPSPFGGNKLPITERSWAAEKL